MSDRATDIDRVCDRVSTALSHYLNWLNESEAALWSGHGKNWLREHRAGFTAVFDARKVGRHWFYRASALPRAAALNGASDRARLLINERAA
jgi:hypothetical protein